MPPIRVEKAGESILNISALSTSLAHNPRRKAATMPSTEMHNVMLTMKVTQNVNLSRVSIFHPYA
jgi:hypothetical protein